MFGRAGDDGDRLDLLLQRPDGAHHLKLEDRNAIAEIVERQALEDGIGRVAIGRHIASALLCLDQGIGQLIRCTAIKPHLDAGEVERLAVRPDTADGSDLALAEPAREIGEISVARRGDPAPAEGLPTRPLARHLLLEARGPEERAPDARRAIEPRDRRAFVGARNTGCR